MEKYPSRERVLRLLLILLARPFKSTRRDLADTLGVSKGTIDDDIKAMLSAGLHFKQNNEHKCAIIPDHSFKELEYLMPLTKDEKSTVYLAIDKYLANDRKARNLRHKINSLYDFQRLGIRALRRPELEKIDELNYAKRHQVQVVLIEYRSNSNRIRNRKIEAFDVNAEHGTIQAYDVEDKAVRHFKLNRFKRIEKTDIPWEYGQYHDHKYTDAFRIANNNKKNVELLLDVYAYNALMEHYPNARGDIQEGSQPNTFHFQSKVNADFLGLTNFILANRGHVEILGPEVLREHILEEARGIVAGLEEGGEVKQ